MIRHVRRELEAFRGDFGRSVEKAVFNYTTPAKVVYEYLDAQICVGGVYLKIFVESEAVFQGPYDASGAITLIIPSLLL